MMVHKLKCGTVFILTVIAVVILSCKKSQPAQQAQNNAVLNQAANTHFNIQVYVSSHPNLNGVLGIDTIPNVGVGGLIIVRISTSSDPEFYVYDRACTYDGTTNTHARVFGPTGGVTCKDNVCGSVFSISDGSGLPTHAPATYALKQYHYTYDGTNVLTITN